MSPGGVLGRNTWKVKKSDIEANKWTKYKTRPPAISLNLLKRVKHDQRDFAADLKITPGF